MFSHDQINHFLKILRFEQLLAHLVFADEFHKLSQQRQVLVRTVVRRSQHHEEQVHGLAIHRVVLDARPGTPESDHDVGCGQRAAVRNGHALADPRAAQGLPLVEHLEHDFLVANDVILDEKVNQLFQRFFLGGGFHVRQEEFVVEVKRKFSAFH